MSFERVYRSTSQNHTHNWSTPAIPQKTEQTKKSLVPKTPEEIENQAFKQNKFDAISLEIKEKRGTITATEAEKLAVLRAKMDLFWEKRMERALAKPNWYETHRANNNASVAMETSIESVQSKLSIGKPNDFYEQEADKVADEVVQKINSPVNDVHFSEKKIQRQVLPLIEEEEEKSAQTKPEITSLQHQEIPSMEEEEDENEMVIAKSEISSPQRQEISSMEFEEEEEQLATKPEISYLQHQKIDTSQELAGTTNLETSIERERGLGEPIEKPLQSKLEQGFGADFSQVKIHNDTTSDRLNQAIHAKAFTTGEDIFFKAGEYNPESFEGQKLLAHELTHVVQQTGGRKVRSSFSQKPVEISKKSSVSRQEDDRQPVPKQKISFGSNPILSAIAELVKNIPGYYLLRVILGKDPITQESVPKSAANKIRGVISLIPGGEILYQQLNLTGAIDRGGEWLDKNIAKLNLTWEYISSLLSKAKSSLSPWDLLSPFKAFGKIKKVFLPLTNRIINFAKSAVNKLLEFVLEGALKLAGPQATRVMGVLKGAGELFTNIIKNPRKFINNLVTGLRQGFQNFIGNISTHIKTGLIGWLTGAYAQANISIPENIFSLSGAFNLVTQVLGLTFNYIRSKAVKMFGEKAVSTIEKGSELFQTLKSGGIHALWDLVKDKMNDLKSMVIDQIKDTVVGQVIQAGIKWIISLLNPAGALLKAGMAIYQIITFFVDRAAQVVELVQSVTFAISAIARGALEGAANKVENALAKSLPVAIGFLASLLGISGLAKRVQNIVERVRGKIDLAIERVLLKARKAVKNLYQPDRSPEKKDLTSNRLGNERRETELFDRDNKFDDEQDYPNDRRSRKEDEDKDRDREEDERESLADKERKVTAAVNAAVAAVNTRYGGQEVDRSQLLPILRPIKLRYQLVHLRAITEGNKWSVEGEINPTYRDLTDSFHKEGDLDKGEEEDLDYRRMNRLLEKAIEGLRHEFYKGNSNDSSEIESLPEGIQKTIASIQNQYFNATSGKNNVITVGGHQFFVDRGRNIYVYPLRAAKEAGIIVTKDKKITTKEQVDGYEYSKFPGFKMGRLRNLLEQIQANIQSDDVDETAILIASLAAEPFRYPPSHITNLIALDYINSDRPAFDFMAMTAGGTDPKSAKNIEKDIINDPKVGTIPEKVRDRQLNIVKNNPYLKDEIELYFITFESAKDAKLIGIFKGIIRKYIKNIS